MRFQNTERKSRKIFEKKGNLLKFHPIIDLAEEEQKAYFEDNNLPKHPLEKSGLSFHWMCAVHIQRKRQKRPLGKFGQNRMRVASVMRL